MPTAKVTLVARRVAYIETALEKLECDLESATEAHRQRVLAWIASVHEGAEEARVADHALRLAKPASPLWNDGVTSGGLGEIWGLLLA